VRDAFHLCIRETERRDPDIEFYFMEALKRDRGLFIK
jgi:hypothetical protein